MQEINEKYIQWGELVDKFLRKQLSPDEESAFMNQMKADKEFNDYVTMSVLLIDGIRKEGKKNDEEVIDAIKNGNKQTLYSIVGKKQPAITHKIVWLPSAAAIAAVFIGFVVINKGKINDDSLNYALEQSSTSAEFSRGASNDSIAGEVTRLSNNTKKKRYMNSTIVRLEEMYQKAMDNITDDEDDYAYTIGWNLACAYLENDQKEEALMILQQMQMLYPKDANVNELIEKLNRTFFWQ